MMEGKARSIGLSGKVSAFLVAMLILLSIFTPMLTGTTGVDAANGSYNGDIYVDFSLNDEWFTYAKSNNLSVGGNALTVVSDTLYKTSGGSYSGDVELKYFYKIADPAADKARVYLKSTEFGGTPYAYYWGGGVATTDFPGAKMTSLKNGFYYFDYPKAATNIIFSNGNSGTGNQTGDLTINKTNNCVFNGSSWVALNQADITTTQTRSIALTDRTADTNNKIYVLADGSLKWSKYSGETTSQTYSGETVTVKLYAPDWTNHQVVYDVDEPNPAQWATNDMTSGTATTDDGQTIPYYYVDVPVGSSFYFQPNTNLKTDILTVPENNDNLYYSVTAGKWVTLSDLVTHADFNVPSNWDNRANIVGVKATYFDYLSDQEINNNQWLDTTTGDYQFGHFNQYISEIAAAKPAWTYPLYFGNFWEKDTVGYKQATSSLTGYDDSTNKLWAINNANGMYKGGGNYNQSLMGLAYPTLDASGNIQVAEGVKMPYFDAQALQSSGVAKVIDSYFPFVAKTDANGVTTYSFDSTDGKNNVYFAWDNDVPKYVNYGGTEAAYYNGFFPFNSNDNVKSVPKPNDDSGDSGDGGSGDSGSEPTATQIVWTEKQSSNNNMCYKIAIPKTATTFTIKNSSGTSKHKDVDLSKLDNGTVYKTEGGTFSNTNSYPTIDDKSGGSYSDNNYYYIVIEDVSNWETNGGVYVSYVDGTETKEVKLVDGATSGGTTGGGTGASGPNVASDEVWVAKSANSKSDLQFYNGSNYSSIDAGGRQYYTRIEKYNDEEYYVIKQADIDKSGLKGDIKLAWTGTGSWKNDIAMAWGTAYAGDHSVVSGSGTGSGTGGGTGGGTGDYYTRYSNSEKDYGFGTRLDIDFRVPKYGTVDGTESGTPVKFNFSGDDDLWVYITDDSGNSNLVLDLGGCHAATTGSINFNDMTATANDVFANYSGASTTPTLPTVPNDEFWVKKSTQPSNTVEFLLLVSDLSGKAFSGYNSGIYVKPYEESDGYYKFKKEDLGNNTKATFVKWQNPTDGKTSGELTLSNLYGNAWKANGHPLTLADIGTEDSTNLGAVTTSFNKGKQLDPNKTYHMTVFFMERGMGDSNMKVEFTMTVASHDLAVDKSVNVDGVNSGLKDAVRSSDSFDFNSVQGDTTKTTSLKNGEQTIYDKAFTVGDSMNVTENADNAKLKYSTKYTVYDKVSGDTLTFGDGKVTNAFDYINSKNDKNEQTSLQAHFENTALTAPLKVSKDLVDKNGVDITTNETAFNFNIGFDLNGDGAYDNYNLTYELYDADGNPIVNPLTGINSYTATNGNFSITAQQYVMFKGIPLNAKYKITESSLPAGYSIYQINGAAFSKAEYTGTMPDTAPTETETVTFTNKFVPVESFLHAAKNLDKTPYTGTDFKFTQTLLYCDNNKVNSDSYAAYNDTQADISVGKVEFKNIAYENTGKYYYSISESRNDGVAAGKYIMDEHTTYYAVADVTNDSGNLKVDISYYKNYDAAAHSVTDKIDSVVFNNSTAAKYTDVSFTKTKEDGTTALSGAEFTLYTDADCKTAATVGTVSKTGLGFENPATSAESTGNVTFKQLKYEPSKTGYVKATYYFKETKAQSGYQLLPGIFTIQIDKDGGYTITYDGGTALSGDAASGYKVKNLKQPSLPTTGGTGVTMFYVLGAIAVIGAGTAFILYRKREYVIAFAKQLIHQK